MTAEREVLGTTLRRIVEALVAGQPAASGRAVRVTRTVTELAEARGGRGGAGTRGDGDAVPPRSRDPSSGRLAQLDTGRPLTEDEAELVAASRRSVAIW